MRLKIKKYLKGGRPHVIVHTIDNHHISVGLTSDNPKNKRNQKLNKVYESRGKISRLKRNATYDSIYNYSKKMNFTIDEQSEEKAIKIANNKLKKIKKEKC